MTSFFNLFLSLLNLSFSSKVLVSEFSLGVAPTTLYLDNDALEDTYFRTAGIKRSKKESEVEKGDEEGIKKESEDEKEKGGGNEDGSNASAGQFPSLRSKDLFFFHLIFLLLISSSLVFIPSYTLLRSPLPISSLFCQCCSPCQWTRISSRHGTRSAFPSAAS